MSGRSSYPYGYDADVHVRGDGHRAREPRARLFGQADVGGQIEGGGSGGVPRHGGHARADAQVRGSHAQDTSDSSFLRFDYSASYLWRRGRPLP